MTSAFEDFSDRTSIEKQAEGNAPTRRRGSQIGGG
jgi:hypothetical protein